MKYFRISLLTCVIVLLSVTMVYADLSGPPTADTWAPGANGTSNGLQLWAQKSSFGGFAENGRIYMEWNLATRPADPPGVAINFARIALTTSATVNYTGDYKFELWSVTDAADTWTEDSSFSDLSAAPALGTKLADGAATLTKNLAGQTVTFESAALAAHFESARNGTANSKAGLAVKLVEPLPADCIAQVVCVALVEFTSKEAGSPALLVTNTDSNAVTLRFFRSDGPAVNWPLLAGGAALAALLAGAGVYRWRLRRAEAR